MNEAGQIVHEKADQIEGEFNNINKAAAGLALGFTAVGGAIAASLLSATTSLAKLGDRADDLRLPVNLIQALSVVSDEARVPAALLTTAMDKFAEASKKGGDEAKTFEKALGNVGDNFLQAFKSADSQEARLKIVSDALRSTTDEVKRAQLSLQAFGSDNERLIGVLGNGASSFERYRQRAAELGLNINESMVKAAQEAKSQLLLLSRVLSDQFTGAVTGLIPLLLKMLPALQAIALAAKAVGAIFADDDRKSVGQLQTELGGLVDEWVKLKEARAALESPDQSRADVLRDKLRGWLGLTVTNEEEMNSLDEAIKRVESRADTVRKLIASKGAEPAATSDKPAFAPRPSLKDESRDRFAAAADSVEKRTAALNAETAAIDLGTAAREKAKIAAQLQTVAMQVNKEAGLGDKVVTEEQTRVIDEFAAAFGRASEAMENARSPLATFGRDSANLGKQLNTFAATSLDSMTNALADVVTHTKTAAEAFSAMARSILNDLAKIAIRQSITGPIAKAFGGLDLFNVGGGVGNNASGTDNWRGGPTWVGENGPEILNVPRGSQIIPNNIASKAGSGGMVFQFTSAPVFQAGIGPADMALIRAQQQSFDSRLRNDVPGIVRAALRNDRDVLNR
jgi:hypothetical protein